MSQGLRERYERELAARHYAPDPAQCAVVDRLDALRTRLLAENQPGLIGRWWQRIRPRHNGARDTRGIYLWGGVGRGKTWLMDLFYASVPIRTRRRSHFHHFMRDIHAQLRTLRGRADPLELAARRMARGTRLLCLDELFVSDIADAMLLGGLFEALLRYGVMLVITSNSPPGELYRDGLQRARFLPAIDLLERELEVIGLEGAVDYRLRQLRRQPIYLDSHAPTTATQLQNLFEQLAPEHGDAGTNLKVSGRSLHALRRRGDVVWFNFVTLCEGPRSQEDYVEIAQEYRTVLLSDVPMFSRPQQDDAARRFIALLDEFYDQGVKLILSAEAAPEGLYRAERLQFEFRRAASRLVEMQTEDYLARPHRT
ncbi:MAG TPA: cell division protein ZapE [Steroidobacteraceae bacterium]|jgi:cell division protein ZapE|nr:cell division protein ZapE [Steroidobacteraceae bacterium]